MAATDAQTRDVAESSPEPGSPVGGRARGLVRRGLPSALEVLALTSFVLARPLFASFGNSPETFVARGADWTDVILFALVLLVTPVAVVMAGELILGLVAGERLRRMAHVAVVAGLLSVVVWQLVETVADWDSGLGGPVSIAGGLVLTVLWARFGSLASFLRYASIGAVVYLVQFLALSPASSIVMGGRHAAANLGPVGLGADAAPVVLVVLDGLPTELLLDGAGHIDAELYPNLAALADDATWYRNHTTVAPITLEAVPAILSGAQPSPEAEPALASNYPRNIFTLLGSSHSVHAAEQVTGLCPVSVCPEPAGSPLGGLLHDAGRIWREQMADTATDPELVPAAFDDRYRRAGDWIDQQDFTGGDKPGLHVLHLMLPHPGWDYLPDGSRYRPVAARPSGLFIDTWSGWGIDVGRQRHVLQAQAADRLLGELLDRLRADDAYDESLVAVTSDHGYSFEEESPWRGVDEDNFDQIMWTPLIVKAPGQHEPEVDDSNVNSLDIVPTIAAELGIEDLPWDAAGDPAGTAERDPEDKWIVDWEWSHLDAHGDDVVSVDGIEGFERVLAADPVEGTGPLAVWRRTEYGALVGAEVTDLEVGDPADQSVAVQDLDRWNDVDVDRPPIELVANSPVPSGSAVALTVDGVVAAVVPTSPSPYGVAILHGLLWPEALHEGRNEIGAYLVDGPADTPVLHELDVEAKGDE
jgi:hypothetical protein